MRKLLALGILLVAAFPARACPPVAFSFCAPTFAFATPFVPTVTVAAPVAIAQPTVVAAAPVAVPCASFAVATPFVSSFAFPTFVRSRAFFGFNSFGFHRSAFVGTRVNVAVGGRARFGARVGGRSVVRQRTIVRGR